MQVDAAVVGGGVIGLAVAARLARGGMDVALLERHESFGREASSRNSEVVHAGMYYPTGSIKARLCVAGNLALYGWCDAHGVKYRRVGKFIVATSLDEVSALEGILARGMANGVEGMRWAAAGELEREEPEVRAAAALWSPFTGIVDSHGFMQSLADEAVAHGALLGWGHAYLGAERTGEGYAVRYRSPEGAEDQMLARRVVNAAGLSADDVAAGMGLDIDALQYRLCFVRGCYFRLGDRWTGRLRHLVYPVPHAGLSGLGVHVTVDLAGGARLGPDVELLAEKVQDYRVAADRAEAFATAARTYLPNLRVEDIRPDQAGIRARRIVPEGGAPDFIIADEGPHGLPGWVNLIGIESPGLTCALPLADRVYELVA
ncbi:MAG TPA: NAD(P)/FAD-dependent oxidoreductase [Gemmatimonadales bacterium]|nr:NAD(P)/FAD-dependent oxidoreductase [Gemmatimonadales bacterium]